MDTRENNVYTAPWCGEVNGEEGLEQGMLQQTIIQNHMLLTKKYTSYEQFQYSHYPCAIFLPILPNLNVAAAAAAATTY